LNRQNAKKLFGRFLELLTKIIKRSLGQ